MKPAAAAVSSELAVELAKTETAPNDEGPPRILTLPHGIHRGIPESVYHKPVLGLASKSTLDDVRRSPAHYAAAVSAKAGGDEGESDAFTFGKAFHCALFEPARFEADYSAEPDFGDCRFKENKARRDDWRKANATKTPLPMPAMTAILGMCEAVKQHPIAWRLLCDGSPEVTLRWRDPETGLECKGRLDYHCPARRLAVDVKTTEDARIDTFRRTVAKYGYHRQDAMYRDGLDVLGAPIDHFIFIAIEKAPPYAIGLFSLDMKSVAKGRDTIHQDLRALADAFAQDRWPAYSTSIQPLTLPDWSE
jgi:hypothetical protein